MPEALHHTQTPGLSDQLVHSVRDAIALLAKKFRQATIPSPELDARLLVLGACGLSHEDYLLNPDRFLTSAELENIAAFQARRLDREPVSRILGTREFWGRRFVIGPAVLDPRPDTETLIEAALGLIRQEARDRLPLKMIDLGTGSGCILLTLLAELPLAWGVGVDRNAEVLQIAMRNAADLGLDERVAFACSDWLDAISGSFGLILANPPYIKRGEIAALEPEVRRYDPLPALDGGEDGLDAYRRIIHDVARVAAPGAWTLVEAGAGQACDIIALFAEAGWSCHERQARVYSDLAGVERVVAIMRQAE